MADASVSPKGVLAAGARLERQAAESLIKQKMSDKSDILVDNKGLEPLTLSTSRRRSTN